MAHLENTIAKLLTERLAANLEKAGITDNGVPLSGLGARRNAPVKMTKSKVLKTHYAAIRDAAAAMAASVRAQTANVKSRVATDVKMRLVEVPPGLRRELLPAVKMRQGGAWLTRQTAFFTAPEMDWTDLRPGTRTAEALPNIHLTEDIARRGAREAAKVVAEGGSAAQARERLRLLGIKPARKGRPPATAGERAFPFVWDALPRLTTMAGTDLDKGAQAFDGYDLDEGAQAFSGYDIVKGAQAFGWLGQDIETGAQAFGQVRRPWQRFFPRISRVRAARAAAKKISEARRKRRSISIPKAAAEALRTEATRESLRAKATKEALVARAAKEALLEKVARAALVEGEISRVEATEETLVEKVDPIMEYLRAKATKEALVAKATKEAFVAEETGQAFGWLGQDVDTGVQAFDGYDLEEGAQAFSGVGQAGAEQNPWIEW